MGQSYYFPAGAQTDFQHKSECSSLCLNCQMFKGPNQDIDSIYTAPSSAVCGVTLETNGKEYLITGTTLTPAAHHTLKQMLILASSPYKHSCRLTASCALSFRYRQTGGWRDDARHAVRLHRALGVHECHPEEEPDSALCNGLWLQGKVKRAFM